METENKEIDFANSKYDVVVSAHDVGAANIIFSFIEKYKHHNYFYNLEGPAKKFFLKKEYKNYHLDEIPDSPDFLISGTGWQTDHEHLARKHFYSKNLYVITVIDHWVNYPERFKKDKDGIFRKRDHDRHRPLGRPSSNRLVEKELRLLCLTFIKKLLTSSWINVNITVHVQKG